MDIIHIQEKIINKLMDIIKIQANILALNKSSVLLLLSTFFLLLWGYLMKPPSKPSKSPASTFARSIVRKRIIGHLKPLPPPPSGYKNLPMILSLKNATEPLPDDYVKSWKSSSARKKRRMTLVLDLDETLVHASANPTDPFRIHGGDNLPYDLRIEVKKNIDGGSNGSNMKEIFVWKRPYLGLFLREMSKVFEIVIFTAGQRRYASPLVDEIDPLGVVRRRYFRDTCLAGNVVGKYKKDLSKVVCPEHWPQRTILLDNSPSAYEDTCPNNAVPIKGFFGNDLSDCELLHLIPFLSALSNVNDVRSILQLRNSPQQLEKIMNFGISLNNDNHNHNHNNNNNERETFDSNDSPEQQKGSMFLKESKTYRYNSSSRSNKNNKSGGSNKSSSIASDGPSSSSSSGSGSSKLSHLAAMLSSTPFSTPTNSPKLCSQEPCPQGNMKMAVVNKKNSHHNENNNSSSSNKMNLQPSLPNLMSLNNVLFDSPSTPTSTASFDSGEQKKRMTSVSKKYHHHTSSPLTTPIIRLTSATGGVTTTSVSGVNVSGGVSVVGSVGNKVTSGRRSRFSGDRTVTSEHKLEHKSSFKNLFLRRKRSNST
jgi:Dullard-like phosphatase family protein